MTHRYVSETGGEKEVKDRAFHLIPSGPLEDLARLYHNGQGKYGPRNWEAGYPFSLSFSALQRHAWQWWAGENNDDEMGLSHMTAVAWHAFALVQFTRFDLKPGYDDRPRYGG